MKTIYTFLFLFVTTVTTFAQGIAVQGIARDNTNAAITNEILSFNETIKIIIKNNPLYLINEKKN